MPDNRNADSGMASDAMDFNLEGDMYAWTADTLQDGGQSAQETFVQQNWTAHPTPAPTPTNQTFPVLGGLSKASTIASSSDIGISKNLILTPAVQPSIDALLDLVVEMQALQSRSTIQRAGSDDQWLRDDEPVLQSLAVLCGVVEEMIRCNTIDSQMQVCRMAASVHVCRTLLTLGRSCSTSYTKPVPLQLTRCNMLCREPERLIFKWRIAEPDQILGQGILQAAPRTWSLL